LLGDVRQAVAVSLRDLLRRVRRSLADSCEYRPSAICHSSVELTIRITVERAAGWIRRVLGDSRELKRFAVVERGVTAAMQHSHWMVGRDLVEIVNVERALVLELRVVEEVSLDPRSRRRLACFGAQLVDDAGDRHELDLERIADEHLVEQRRAAGVVVTVDESGHHCHPFGVDRLAALGD
jgi:hypothetical protein